MSRAWPYLLTTADERAAWSKPAEGKQAASEADVQRALLQRLQRLQLPSGGFGLWDGRSDEEQWLTAYAADYLLARREAGDAVPEAMLNQALNRLQSYLTDSQYGERWSSAPSTAVLPIRLTVPMCWPGWVRPTRYLAPCLGAAGRSRPFRFAALAPLAGALGHGG